MKICYIPPKNKKQKNTNVYAYSSLLYTLFPIFNKEFALYLCIIAILGATYYGMDLKEKHDEKKIKDEDSYIKKHDRKKKLENIQKEIKGPEPVVNVDPKNLF